MLLRGLRVLNTCLRCHQLKTRVCCQAKKIFFIAETWPLLSTKASVWYPRPVWMIFNSITSGWTCAMYRTFRAVVSFIIRQIPFVPRPCFVALVPCNDTERLATLHSFCNFVHIISCSMIMSCSTITVTRAHLSVTFRAKRVDPDLCSLARKQVSVIIFRFLLKIEKESHVVENSTQMIGQRDILQFKGNVRLRTIKKCTSPTSHLYRPFSCSSVSSPSLCYLLFFSFPSGQQHETSVVVHLILVADVFHCAQSVDFIVPFTVSACVL